MNSLITGSCLLHFSEGFHPRIVQAVQYVYGESKSLIKNDLSTTAFGKDLERATGIEPVTSSLGSWHSTAELRPLRCSAENKFIWNYDALVNQRRRPTCDDTFGQTEASNKCQSFAFRRRTAGDMGAQVRLRLVGLIERERLSECTEASERKEDKWRVSSDEWKDGFEVSDSF